MRLRILRAKLHQATVTHAALNYHGSLTIDPELMAAVGLHPYEAITVGNAATGLRGETYAIPGVPGQGQIELNGAMARLGAVGDRLIIMAFAELEPQELPGFKPRVVVLDQHNHILEVIDSPPIERAWVDASTAFDSLGLPSH